MASKMIAVGPRVTNTNPTHPPGTRSRGTPGRVKRSFHVAANSARMTRHCRNTSATTRKAKADSENIPLPNDVAFFLASQIDSNIRILEGSLIRIGAFSSLTKTPVDIQLAKEVLKNIIKSKEALISIDHIQKVVSGFFNLKVSDLKTKRKYKGYVLPRQVGMYLSRKLTDSSLLEIGEKFGGKDHSTVLHSIKKVEERMEKEPSFKETIDHLLSRIKS